MPTLIVTRGLPASGKTTRARAWVAEYPAGRARINRDDTRSMLHGGWFGTPGHERQITAVCHTATAALLKAGVDVVCDDTNLPARVVRGLRRLATQAGADFQVWDLTDVPLDECLRRNAQRTGPARVPEDAITDKWRRYVHGRPYPLPDEPAGNTRTQPYTPPAGAPTAVVVDVDGTVALMCDRSPYDETRVGEDRPNPGVIAAVRAMHAAGHAVVFCSGRTDGCRAATEKWLAEHVAVPYAALHMRAAGDVRKDAIVKREIFDRHIRDVWDVIAVFDDRAQVVRMWRDQLGLTVLQCADGDF